MGVSEKVFAQVTEQARRLYPGTIAVGLLTWPDLGGDSDKAAMQARAGGFPAEIALAVTETQIFATAYKSGWSGLKLKEELGTWPRSQVKATVSHPYEDEDRFRLELTTPDRRIELDGTDAQGVNRDFLTAVTQTA